MGLKMPAAEAAQPQMEAAAQAAVEASLQQPQAALKPQEIKKLAP